MLAGLKEEDLLEREKNILDNKDSILYSKRYSDDDFEYRHVILPKPIAKWVPFGRLMTEDEWRSLGVMQSPGWVHYMIHAPEPHILLFKRLKSYAPPQQEIPPNYE